MAAHSSHTTYYDLCTQELSYIISTPCWKDLGEKEQTACLVGHSSGPVRDLHAGGQGVLCRGKTNFLGGAAADVRSARLGRAEKDETSCTLNVTVSRTLGRFSLTPCIAIVSDRKSSSRLQNSNRTRLPGPENPRYFTARFKQRGPVHCGKRMKLWVDSEPEKIVRASYWPQHIEYVAMSGSGFKPKPRLGSGFQARPRPDPR
ncbi:hypothetical protein DFH09DRAFT_1073250 [Mycena vulgaris]|nr:hypothetical protein DFH09DRAFT_1073250 [Mycena vulgaris]